MIKWQLKLTLIFISLSSLSLVGQNIDSLEQVVSLILAKKSKNISKKEVKTILDLAELYNNKDATKQQYYALQGLHYSQFLSDNGFSEMDALVMVSQSFLHQNKLDSCISILKNGILKFEKENGNKVYLNSLGNLYQHLGFAYRDASDFVNAAYNFDQAARYFEKGEDYKNQMAAKYNQANLLTRLDNFEEAERAYNELLEITDLPIVHSTVYLSLSTLEAKQNNFNKAVQYLERSIELKEHSNEPELIYLNLGIVYRKLGELNKSKQNFLIAESLSKKTKRTRPLLKIYNNLVKVLIEKNELDLAIKYLEISKGMVKPENLGELAGIYARSSAIFEKKGNWKDALDALKMNYYYLDSIDSTEKLEIVSEVQAKFENEKKEAENLLLIKDKELQNATIKQQQVTLWFTVIGLGLLGLLAFFFYRRSSERKQTNSILSEQKSQIEILHKELAHRVKNNLMFMSSMLRMQSKSLEDGEAKQAIKEGEARLEAMSLLHRKLGLDDKNGKVNIGDYIKEICAYLNQTFSKTYYGLKISVDSDDLWIDAEYAMRVGIIINELVTNSVKYAFENQPEPRITASIKKYSKQKFSVLYNDNGIGVPDGFENNNTKSVGMKLIKTLTKQLQGSMSVRNNDGTTIDFQFISPNTLN